MRHLAFAAVVLAFSGVASAAPAVPSMSVDPVAQPVACRWVGGSRVCDGSRAVIHRRDRSVAYGAYPNNGPPEAYRVGSTDWWRAMDRECRGGFRCR